MPDTFAPGTPAWVDLVTSDPDGARVFYGGLFGWEFDIGGAETGRYTYCLAEGRRAAGMVGQPVGTMPPAWTTYLATDDADATARRVPDAGGTIVMGPVEAGPAGRVVIATDPAGATIGAWQGREHPGAEVTDAPGAVAWTELLSSDLDGVTPFYSDVFGVRWARSDMPGWSRYATFSVGEQLAGGATVADGDATGWLPYFAVADAEEAVGTIDALGGAVVTTPAASPFGRWVRARDPQGALFQILEQAR